MKAVLIDPFEKTVKEVEHNGDYKQIYEFIQARTFDVVRLAASIALYVDGEGLLKDQANQRFFQLTGFQPFAGRGLVLGVDGEGESTDCIIPVAFIRLHTEWCRSDLRIAPKLTLTSWGKDGKEVVTDISPPLIDSSRKD